MITHDQLKNVVDHPVFDTDGKKIGDARHVFFDDASGKPEWVTVKTGLFGNHESFVPIRDAQVVDDHMAVPFSKNKVKDAPSVDVDAGGHSVRPGGTAALRLLRHRLGRGVGAREPARQRLGTRRQGRRRRGRHRSGRRHGRSCRNRRGGRDGQVA
ncbi:PRC-barrel domain-containing protein [Yinghuangia aomiensis]